MTEKQYADVVRRTLNPEVVDDVDAWTQVAQLEDVARVQGDIIASLRAIVTAQTETIAILKGRTL